MGLAVLSSDCSERFQAVGKEAYAIVPGEIGGGNGLEALVVAADMGLPVVDADFMGRAFPELQVCSSSLQDEHGSLLQNLSCLHCL